MRVFVAGADGFVGRHVVAALRRAGRDVILGVRGTVPGGVDLAAVDRVMIDFSRDDDPAIWSRRLSGFDAAVNCVGILQSTPGNTSRRVHVDATIALFRGAHRAGVRRLVHISAMGADTAGVTDFARDKATADAALAALDFEWIVLRPSLVYAGRNSGGSALIETLAGMPLIVPLPAGDIAFQPIHADDLAEVCLRCLDPDVQARRVYELGGPERLTLRQIVAEMHSARGRRPARFVVFPDALVTPVLKIGDWAARLGIVTPWRSTALVQARRTPVPDSEAIVAATGVVPRPMRVALREAAR